MKEKLIEACKDFALQLLNDFGEFYPFAFAIASDKETIVSVVTESDDNDKPKSGDEIVALESTFHILGKEHDFEAVCICVDVLIVEPDSNEKRNCIEIRIDTKSGSPTNCYIPYNIEGGKVILSKSFEKGGTFLFFNPAIEFREFSVFTIKSIFLGRAPILYVVHDRKGYWQFISGEEFDETELMQVDIREILEFDPSVAVVMSMQDGYEAYRDNPEVVWQITQSINEAR
ncbi:MAG TPA: hypothetical protein VL098_08380 [Flavipsychrobacter sp.]|nr:hypothetical protein [Flavipsychrobacter sp.]